MNKIFFSLLVLGASLLSAESSIEFRAGAFIPSSQSFQDIYGKAGVSYQLEAATNLYENGDGWVNLDFFTKNGNSLCLENSTTANILNVSFGVKIPYRLSDRLTAYFGFGPSVSCVWIKNKYSCCDGSTHTEARCAVGAVAKSGVLFFVSTHIFLDLFVDYLYQPVMFDRRVQMGGFKVGGGIGTTF